MNQKQTDMESNPQKKRINRICGLGALITIFAFIFTHNRIGQYIFAGIGLGLIGYSVWLMSEAKRKESK